ncbi:hypothetical protein K8W59_14695 [Nocardioides rotundus]|uniref:hypothetical protein n=1 Tax=Nocardioides rotundus TaxID=1774216 RepID=UPI001CBB1C3B|nr:hypothetical protein [Nocardioides rotundus]UAL29041.1 hypothetical protein K8W59_14695 [Nocardioides rotundus]
MSALAGTVVGLAFGFVSAVVPVVNAEAYAIASVAGNPWLLVPTVVALASGQTAGKLVMFEAARRGSTRLSRLPKIRKLSSGRWAVRIQRALQEPRSAKPVVLSAAGLGLPPLALVSVAAGAAGQPRCGFALMCFAGRAARFAVLAAPVAFAVAHS